MDTVEAETNCPEWLSQVHIDFMLGYLEMMQQREQAAVDAFLSKERD
jgi:hypothetical protein